MTESVWIEARTLGELRDAVAGLIKAHGDAFPVCSCNDGFGLDHVVIEVAEYESGLTVMLS